MVSIIVPVYNASKYLDACIVSLLSQSYRDIEILLVNDGSQDDSLEICNKYAQSDRRIQVFHQENAGVSAARNNGLRVCQGEWICFVDSDDFAETEMVRKMLYMVNKYDADMAMFGYYIIDGKKKSEINVTEHDRLVLIKGNLEEIIKLSMNSKINPPYCKMYKKEIVLANRLKFDEESSLGEDFLFNMEYISCVNRLVLGTDKIYTYKVDNQGSLTNRSRPNLLAEELKMYHGFVKFMGRNNNLYEQGKLQEYILLVVRVYLSNFFSNYKNMRKRFSAIKRVLTNDEIRREVRKAKPQSKLNCLLKAMLQIRFEAAIYLFFDLKWKYSLWRK